VKSNKVGEETPAATSRGALALRNSMKRLAHREREKHQKLVRRLRAAGIPVYFETNEDAVEELLIRQDFDAYESILFDVNEGAGVILPLRITPNIPVFAFSGFDVRLPRWPEVCFRPLKENVPGQWPHYEFWGRPALKFDRSEIINRFIAAQTVFRRGYPVHGLLLAFSCDPLPDDLIRGEVLRGSIKILDQFDHEHSAELSLRVDRETPRKNNRNRSPRKRQALFINYYLITI